MNFKLEKAAIQKAVAKLKFRTQAFIDGTFTNAQSGKTFTTENPATGKPLAQIAAGDASDVDRAVKAARRAFESGVWSQVRPGDRKKVLLKWADLLEANASEIALLDTLEAGKPIGDCTTMDIPDAIHCIRWHAEATDKLYSHVSPTGPENLALVLREPVGVVGCVIPWNFPAQMAAWKLGPALATGNSVVLKPAELTSLSAIRMAELAAEAGLPAGVLNVVPGLGETAGQAIGRHRDVDMVAFTARRRWAGTSCSMRRSRISSGSFLNAAARVRRSCLRMRRTSTRWRRTRWAQRFGTWARIAVAARGSSFTRKSRTRWWRKWRRWRRRGKSATRSTRPTDLVR